MNSYLSMFIEPVLFLFFIGLILSMIFKSSDILIAAIVVLVAYGVAGYWDQQDYLKEQERRYKDYNARSDSQ